MLHFADALAAIYPYMRRAFADAAEPLKYSELGESLFQQLVCNPLGRRRGILEGEYLALGCSYFGREELRIRVSPTHRPMVAKNWAESDSTRLTDEFLLGKELVFMGFGDRRTCPTGPQCGDEDPEVANFEFTLVQVFDREHHAGSDELLVWLQNDSVEYELVGAKLGEGLRAG
jgi:hypothetical protein